MIFPKKNFEPNSKGEEYVWRQFKGYLPKGYVSFHNYCIENDEADIIMLIPDFGVLIIEIKGFYPQNVIEAIDNTNILLANGNVERSPMKQARRYRNKLLEKLQSIDSNMSEYIAGVAVCFPYFNKNDIENKHLNRICDDRFIIGAEDLVDWNAFFNKLLGVTEKTNEIWLSQGKQNDFSEEDLKKVASVFVPDIEFDNDCGSEQIEYIEEYKKEQEYSILISSTAQWVDQALVDSVISAWIRGTKVYFFSNCKEACEELLIRANKYIELNNIKDELIDETENIFNFNVEYTREILEDFIIVNGEDISIFRDKIKSLANKVSFNAEQYIAEHASCNDMMVKAGAGTGKTYLLVSRIAYLCWKHKYSSDDLLNKIILITFTNDATDEMRERLVSYFSNMFVLTYNLHYFQYAENVENMNISTIDSLGKKIISKFAFYLGLGNKLSVTSGTMIKREQIRKRINEFAKNNQLVTTSYKLEKFLNSFIEKIGNRSKDSRELDEIFHNACMNENMLGGLVEKVPEIIRDIEKSTEENNQILMSHIIIYLRRIVELLKNKKIAMKDELELDYVFIDEFQDTDDTQIELVADFKQIYGFNLFVVGDPKQSIYRFRGASDDKAFSMLNEKVGYEITLYPLVKNYRSNAQLLEYMDQMFKKLAECNELLKYQKQDKLVGVKNKQERRRVTKYDIIKEEERESQFVKALAEFRKNAEENENLAILVRSNNEVEKIREMCVRNNIMDVDIDTGGRLYKSEAVVDIYKLLLALQNNMDASCVFNLYTTAYCNSSVNKKEVLLAGDKLEYFYHNLPESLERWNDYVEQLQYEPVLKVLRTVIDDVQPSRIFSQRCNVDEKLKEKYEARYKNNIEKLFEKIAIENNGEYLTVGKLIEFLKIMITTHQEEEEREIESDIRIQCRTVHRAKGKEYTYVLFPFADERIKKDKYYGEMNVIIKNDDVGYYFQTNDKNIVVENNSYASLKNTELTDQSYEEARIFYVAVTRAKKGIVYIKNVSKQKMKDVVMWQQFLEER